MAALLFSLLNEGGVQHSSMKLVVLLSLVAFVACDYTASDSETPTNAFGIPEKGETTTAIKPGKYSFNYKNFYHGAFPPTRFPAANFFSPTTFSSFSYPLKAFNYAASPQGILPPISQIIPPQISQIVPPISQIVPPIFGTTKPVLPTLPALPVPAPVLPAQTYPPQILSSAPKPLFNQFTYPYYSPLHPFSYYPSTYPFPSTSFFSTQNQKQPANAPQDAPSTSYGAPVSEPVEPEPTGPAESSAPFDPSPVSYPYEPAVPETQEPAAPYKPAQEYGLPPTK